MERALVLSADAWDMTDEQTGEQREGVTVWYVNDYREDSKTSIGFKPTKVTAVPEMLEHLRAHQLPAVFAMHYGSRPGAQNKATLTLIKADHVRNVQFFLDSPAQPQQPKA